MRKFSVWSVWILSATLGSTSGCFVASDLLGQPCSEDEACSDGQVCQNEVCISADQATSEADTQSSDSSSEETTTEESGGDGDGDGETTSQNESPYGDPMGGCMDNENPIMLSGVDGGICAPMCTQDMDCPDAPPPATGVPMCLFQYDGAASATNCALVCDPMGIMATCPTGSECTDIGETFFVCMYPPG